MSTNILNHSFTGDTCWQVLARYGSDLFQRDDTPIS